MTAALRAPCLGELGALSDLCLRSKATWGYDSAFLELCRDALTLTPADLSTSWVRVASRNGQALGVVQVGMSDRDAELEKLFVDPRHLRHGLGRSLLAAARAHAASGGATCLSIAADPGAVAFYRAMGALPAGEVPSDCIAGRTLPRLVLPLSPALDPAPGRA